MDPTDPCLFVYFEIDLKANATLGARSFPRAVISYIFTRCSAARCRPPAVPDISRKRAAREPLVPRIGPPSLLLILQSKLDPPPLSCKKRLSPVRRLWAGYSPSYALPLPCVTLVQQNGKHGRNVMYGNI